MNDINDINTGLNSILLSKNMKSFVSKIVSRGEYQEYNYLNIPKEIVEKLELEDEYVTIKVTGNTMIITKIGETITMPQVEKRGYSKPDDVLI